MVGASDILYYIFHPQQVRNIVQWKVWHTAVHQRDPEKEPESLRTCFRLLDQTSRSFSAVIQELHPELLVPVAIFYLILRGLDTIEDDMTLPLSSKDPLLRNFYKNIEKEGWNFTGSGPNEKDRELLVEFQNVTEEFRKIKFNYKDIIRDITKQMGKGMAEYCANAKHNEHGVETVNDYDLYCYYVAGLVGNGLSRLFIESGFAHPRIMENASLHTSMGLFLQKTNIIRDIKEDFEDKRIFWPREIWSRHVDKFEDLFKPENLDAALNCSSDMVLNALGHVDDCLYYMACIREQSVFNFVAIPQSMAIATLELVFRNPQIFKKNVKITKGDACRLMMLSSQNNELLFGVFRDYARRIHKKNTPRDPNFLKISIACGKIEQRIEAFFPRQNPGQLAMQAASQAPEAMTDEERRQKEMEAEAKQDTMYILAAAIGVVLIISLIMVGVAWFFGARFDLIINELLKGNIPHPDNRPAATTAAQKPNRNEL